MRYLSKRLASRLVALVACVVVALGLSASVASATGGHHDPPPAPEFVEGDCESGPAVFLPDDDTYQYKIVKGEEEFGSKVVVVAKKHYAIVGKWTHRFGEEPEWWQCEPPVPGEPASAGPTCDDEQARLTIPADEHHSYLLDGEPVEAGEHDVDPGEHTVQAVLVYNDEVVGEWTVDIAENADSNCVEPVVEVTGEPVCHPEPQKVTVTNPEGNHLPIAVGFDDSEPRDLPPGESAVHESDADIVAMVDGEEHTFAYPDVPDCTDEDEDDSTTPASSEDTLPKTGAGAAPLALAGLGFLVGGGGLLGLRRRLSS